MQKAAEQQGEEGSNALALLWQGHMLDLLDRRDEAIVFYRNVADMNLEETWMHSQYGIKYSLSPYAGERLKEPFRRIENRNPD